MDNIVSPWEFSVKRVSPDGRVVAVMVGVGEVGQGGPARGWVKLSNGMRFEECGASMVWSEDSRYLAVPRWTRLRDQKLMVVDVQQQRSGLAPATYRVLELHSFANNTIKGIESPIHKPQPVEIHISEIEWE